MKMSSIVLIACFLAVGCQTTLIENPQRVAAQVRSDENVGWEAKEPLEVSKAAFDASNEPSESHANYLSLSTPIVPIQSLFKELQGKEGVKLKSRGEAHITVITPPEFKVLGDAGVTIREIEKIADRLQMPDSDIDPVCVGVGRAELGGKPERTYFVVVRSENLFKVRREVEALYRKKGGVRGFDPERFFPHITVGFTAEDLHEHQGVIKGRNACLYPVRVMP